MFFVKIFLMSLRVVSSYGCATTSTLSHFPDPPLALGGSRILLGYDGKNPYLRGTNVGGSEIIERMRAWGVDYCITSNAIDLCFSVLFDFILLPITLPTELLYNEKHKIECKDQNKERDPFCMRCGANSGYGGQCPGYTKCHLKFFPYTIGG